MDIDRLNAIKKEALKLKAAGKLEEFRQVAKIATDYENGQEMGVISAALIGVADGILARWGDELGGVAYGLVKAATERDLGSYGKGYEKGRDTLRGYQKEAEMTSPWAKGIGEGVGAVVTAGVGPSWLRAGEKGVEAIKLMKAAKGALPLMKAARTAPYIKATGKAIHTLGVPAAKYGVISGAGGAEGALQTPVGMAVGGVGGYVIGGTLGTALGNLFYKPTIEGGTSGVPLTKAEVLNRARETFEPDFVAKHEDNLMNLHDLIKKHGFKGKGIADALDEAEKTGKSLDTQLSSFMSNLSKYYKFHEQKGYVPKQDPTEITARELIEGFEGSLKSMNKEAIDHASERAKLENILTGFKDNLDDNSVRTLGEAEARWKRTGIKEPERDPHLGPDVEYPGQYDKVKYGGDTLGDPITGEVGQQSFTKGQYTPGHKPQEVPESILDKKVFNIKGQRQLLKYINKVVLGGDRSKVDPEVGDRFAGFVRNLYQKNLQKVDDAGMMQYGKDSGVTPETPKKMHELIQLEEAFKSGASKTLNEEADRLNQAAIPRWKKLTRGLGDAFITTKQGPIGQTRTAINVADKLLIKNVKPKGLMDITKEDIRNLGGLEPNVADDMMNKFKIQDIKATKQREYPKLLEPLKDLLSPRIRVKRPTIQFQQQREEDEESRNLYQHEQDIKGLEDTQYRKTMPEEKDMMNWKQSSIKNRRTDKIMAALRKAKLSGEVITPSDPDFKQKIRKYLLDEEDDLA